MEKLCYERRLHRRRALAAVLAGMCSAAAFAQNSLGFLRDAPVGYFISDDFILMQTATSIVLSGTDRGISKSWHNPATGNSGSITLLASFTSTEGRDCKRLRVENHAEEISGSSTVTVCRFPDVGWLIDSSAKSKGLTQASAR
jgi:17 kDa outer membrane surface antigen